MPKRILYVGMDVHLLAIVICVMDQQGKIVSRAVVETSTQAVRDFFASHRGEVHVTFEEGTLAAWLFDVVEPLVTSVIVCNPKHNKRRIGRHRNDKIDAATLDELLRLNAVKAVYHAESPSSDAALGSAPARRRFLTTLVSLFFIAANSV